MLQIHRGYGVGGVLRTKTCDQVSRVMCSCYCLPTWSVGFGNTFPTIRISPPTTMVANLHAGILTPDQDGGNVRQCHNINRDLTRDDHTTYHEIYG